VQRLVSTLEVYSLRSSATRGVVLSAFAVFFFFQGERLVASSVGGDLPTLTAGQMDEAVYQDPLSFPTPGEFFAAIEKNGRPNWALVLRSPFEPAAASRPTTALCIGILVADGYLAVENQDGQTVKNIGRDIMGLARKLNVDDSVIARGNSIADFAERNDWHTLKEELEATQNEVKRTLAEQKDEDLVVLVTVGAWLRGMQAVSKLQLQSYSAETASLLAQPSLADFLIRRLHSLPEKTGKDPGVQSALAGLESIHVLLLDLPEGEMRVENVGELHQLCNHTIAKIIEGEPSSQNGDEL